MAATTETFKEEKAPDAFPLSLDEFCTRLSANDRRVELIGGFHHSEKASGRVRDTEAAYLGRYKDYITQPA